MIDFISGTEVSDSPEEGLVQVLSMWLVAIGYRKEQIQTRPRYTVPIPELGSKANHVVEVAVFRDGRRSPDNLLIVAEAKTEASFKGLDHLHRSLQWSGAQLGLWFDGQDITYLVSVPNAGHAMRDVATVPGAGFGQYIRRRRESLRTRDEKRFSGRAVATRLGCEPSYLNRIELGRERPPSDELLSKLAVELGEREAVLFAQAGRIPPSLHKLILLRPVEYAEILEHLADKPEAVIKKLIDRIKAVKDGDW